MPEDTHRQRRILFARLVHCRVALQVPLAEVKVAEGPHDHVPEADADPGEGDWKVPPKVQVMLLPPTPVVVKVALPLLVFKVPLPAPGTVTVIPVPLTPKPSEPPMAHEVPALNWVPLNEPVYEPSSGGGTA